MRRTLPDLEVVSLTALIVESIDAIDRAALVISTQHEEVLGVFDFVRQQEANGLKAVGSSINIVAKEEVISLWREATILKEAKEVVILAVNVTHDLQWRLKVEQDGLANEKLARLLDKPFDLI